MTLMNGRVGDGFAPVSHVSRAAVIAAAVWAGCTAKVAHAGNSTVVQGNVTFEYVGNTTIIRASDGSIINHFNFNIAPNEVVRFIQPGEWARVLNRITGPDPSIIQGTLLANGQVYIVNPAGVYFHNGAVVDVAGLYAAAGSLSNQRFMNNTDKFTNLTGEVVNAGSITGNNINLIGKNVLNSGAISAPAGTIIMAAGNDVHLIPQGGKISVRIDGTTLTGQNLPQNGMSAPNMTATPGVENTGSLIANGGGTVTLGAGDMYSLAIRNSGLIRASSGEINLVASDGLIENCASGVINTSVSAGTAGDITIQGPSVLNSGKILANAHTGDAGNIEVTSQHHTFLRNGSLISATGGSGNADGGNVLVHSYDGLTVMASQAIIDVSGGATGGNGGFAEVSGANLTFNGYVDLRAKNGYSRGKLLLDPINITVNEFGGDEAFLNDGIIDFNEGDVFVFVSATALQAMVGQITLQATGNISILFPILFDPNNTNDLILEAYENIYVSSTITGARDLILTANYNGLGSGNGFVQIDAPIDIWGNLVASGKSIALVGGVVSTAGYQHYLSPTNLCVDTTLNASSVRFFSTLDAISSGDQGLVVNLSDSTDGEVEVEDVVVFDGAVGGVRMLKSLKVNGETEINGGYVQTRDFQRYFGAVRLGEDAVLSSANFGEIRFADTVDGAFDLLVATGGLTRFEGVVGESEKLTSVFTDAPGATRISSNMAASALGFGDDVVIAGHLTLTGNLSVEFSKSLKGNFDGVKHDLTVNSALTYFRGNVTGFDLLQTNANGTTYFGPAPATDGADPIEVSANQLDFNDDVIVLSDTNFTGLDFVDFGKTLNGEYHVVTNSDNFVRFGGDVGGATPLASLTTNVAHPSVLDQNLVLIDGNLIRVVGDIRFNPGGRTAPAQVATIVGRNGGGLTLDSLEGDVFMGLNEKLTTMGDLTLLAKNGTLTLGDLNAFGDVTVDSPTVYLYAREGGQILNWQGELVDDEQASYVAYGTYLQLNPNMQVTLLGNGKTPIFASRVSDQFAGPFATFVKRLFDTLQKANFTFGSNILDLSPPDLQFNELVDQISGPNQIDDIIILDPVATQPLGNLAINSRPLSDSELRETTTGRYLQSDAFNKPPAGNASDYSVAINRLRREAMMSSLALYSSTHEKQEVDPETGETKSTDQTPAVRAALTKAWNAYLSREAAAGELEPVGFLTYLQSDPEQQEALQFATNLREMLIDLKISGLSATELQYSRNHVLKNVLPEGVTAEKFAEALGVGSV